MISFQINSGTILCVRLWPFGCAGRASRGCPAALSCTSWRRSRRRRWRLRLRGRRRWGFPPARGTEPLSEPSAHSHSETCTVTWDTSVMFGVIPNTLWLTCKEAGKTSDINLSDHDSNWSPIGRCCAHLQSFDQPVGQFYCLVGAVDLFLKA